MKKNIYQLLTLLAFAPLASTYAQNQLPYLLDIYAAADTSSHLLHVYYTALEPEGDPLKISLMVSGDGGKTYPFDTQNAFGVGYPIAATGSQQEIVWQYDPTQLNLQLCQVKVVADDLQPVDIQSIVNSVDAAQLLSDLQLVEGVRHKTANPVHLQAVKDLINQRLDDNQVYHWTHNYTAGSYTGQNFTGKKHSVAHSDTTYIIDGHYDSVAISPGADDNGTAVVGVLEALRLLAPYEFEHNLKFIWFDMEEDGLVGSLRYVTEAIEPQETIGGVVNYEMIAYYSDEPNSQETPFGFDLLFPDIYNQVASDQFRGNFIVNASNANSLGLMNSFAQSAATYVPDLKVVSIPLPGNAEIAPDFRRSDHTAFWGIGAPALMITDGANTRNPYYHTSEDVIDNLNMTFMRQVVQAGIATIAQRAKIRHASSITADVVLTSGLPISEAFLPACNWKASPNPINATLLTLHADNNCNMPITAVKLLNNTGKLLLHQEYAPTFDALLPVTDYPQGIYLVGIERQGKWSYKQLVIMH